MLKVLFVAAIACVSTVGFFGCGATWSCKDEVKVPVFEYSFWWLAVEDNACQACDRLYYNNRDAGRTTVCAIHELEDGGIDQGDAEAGSDASSTGSFYSRRVMLYCESPHSHACGFR